MASIRILEVPPGEAPEEVRRVWVGLTLPLMEGPKGERRIRWCGGVLSAPKTFFGSVVHVLRGRYEKQDVYAVDARAAVAVLAGKDASAAQWWQQNAPHLMKAGATLLFPADGCVEEPPKEEKHPMATPTGD